MKLLGVLKYYFISNISHAPFHSHIYIYIYIYTHLNEPSYHKSLGYHNSNHPQTVRLHNPVHTPPTNRATALPKLQPTTEETTPDPHPITDSLLVTTTKLSPITVNHHQPKPRTPSVLAESAQIGLLHLKTLPDMEFRSQRPPPNL